MLLQTRHMPLFEMTVGQGLSTVKCMWFRGAYLRDKFQVGQMVALYGKLEASRSSAGKFKMIQPQLEILPGPGEPDAEFAMLEVGRIVPVYESLGGTTAWGAKLGSKWLRRVIWGLFEELAGRSVSQRASEGGDGGDSAGGFVRAAGTAGAAGGVAGGAFSGGGDADDGADVGGDAGASAADL